MTWEFPESDWKMFRRLRAVALERFCERILADAQRLAAESDGSFYERYIALYRLLQARDRELAQAFDDPRRSQALN